MTDDDFTPAHYVAKMDEELDLLAEGSRRVGRLRERERILAFILEKMPPKGYPPFITELVHFINEKGPDGNPV